MGQETGRPGGGDRREPQGRDNRFERVEGSFTSGGSVPGRSDDEDRTFEPRRPGHTAPEGEGGGAMSGRGQEGSGDAGNQGDQDLPDKAYEDRGYG